MQAGFSTDHRRPGQCGANSRIFITGGPTDEGEGGCLRQDGYRVGIAGVDAAQLTAS